jgi:4-amino-4-deoxy-L-arabinose transferase-like glycosyltransferase
MRVASRVDRHWLLVLVGIATVVQALSVGRALSNPGHPVVNIDSAFFQHAGWYVTQGAVPYVDIWDIKPPLVIETTTVLAVLAGGDPLLIHFLSVAVTSVAAVGCSLLVFMLAHRLTGNARAALLAGLTLLTVPGFYYLSANGFRPKYLTLFCGLAALLFALRNRPLFAGMAAAASAGYWQYGVIFAALVVGIAIQRRDRNALARQILGMALVTTIVLIPILAWGALVPMLVEVIYVPLTSQAAQPFTQRLGKLVFYLAYALVPAVLGAYGLATGGRQHLPRHWWVYAGAAWGGLQLLLDLDSAPDLFFLVVFLALGVALFAERAKPRTTRLLVGGFFAIVALNALWVGGVVVNPVSAEPDSPGTATGGFEANLTEIAESVDVSRPGEPPRHGIPGVQKLYWNTRMPPSCHYRLSETERNWLTQTGQPYRESRCGTLDGFEYLPSASR